jgi:hypothetical protein
MAQKNRANMLTDIVSNIYNNLINFITGQNAQDRFVNLLDSSPNILSDASQANGYVSTDANNEMFSSYYDEEISRADLISDLTANLAVGGKFYRINDAVGTTITLLVIAESNINLYSIGTDITTGEQGTYDITTDVFTPIVVSGTPDLQQVTDVGATTTNGIIVDDGTNSVQIQPNQLKITNTIGYGTIGAANLTDTPNFELPNKPAGTETFAMLSDITAGGVPYTGATADVDLGIHSLTADTIGIGVAAGAEKLHIDGGATTTRVKIDADNGVSRILSFRTDDLQRWALRVDGTESGSNSGADFQLRRYNDAGAYIDSPIAINRANGNITTAQNINGATPTELGYLSGATSAIQTQLNALAQTVPISSCSNGTAITGTLLNTFTKALPIPAGSRTANQAPQLDVNVEKTGTAGNINVRLYWNTTPDIAGTPIFLGIMTSGATTRTQPMSRILAIEVANGTGNGTKVVFTGTASLTQWASFTSAMSIAAIDWTAAGNIVVAASNGSILDSTVCNMIKLH